MDIDGPQYDLKLIVRIAKSGKFYMERRAANSSRNYGYFDEEVGKCISSFQGSNYYKTISYPNDKGSRKDLVYDVYKINCPNADKDQLDLYIKLRVSSGDSLLVGSFKPDGAM